MITTIFEYAAFPLFAMNACHSLKYRGAYQTMSFFIPVFIWGFILEQATISIFHFYYYPGYRLYLLDVPLSITLYWSAIIYISYCMSMHMTHADDKKSVMKMAAFSAFIGMSIDLFLEPVASVMDLWIWTPPRLYFDAPVGNFVVGWFLAIFLFISFYLTMSGRIRDKKIEVIYVLSSLPVMLIILVVCSMVWERLWIMAIGL